MPYGIDYMWDIERLAASRDLEIKSFFRRWREHWTNFRAGSFRIPVRKSYCL
jgi:hypothetical protein